MILMKVKWLLKQESNKKTRIPLNYVNRSHFADFQNNSQTVKLLTKKK
jgi:hypothetical protein